MIYEFYLASLTILSVQKIKEKWIKNSVAPKVITYNAIAEFFIFNFLLKINKESKWRAQACKHGWFSNLKILNKIPSVSKACMPESSVAFNEENKSQSQIHSLNFAKTPSKIELYWQNYD